jgi:prepilin-type N-terminal cleavage/methylation domain-containing protein
MTDKRNSRGFTLIEVMIALVVFMVAVVGLVAMQRASIVGKTNGEFQTGAGSIAHFFLAQIRSEIESWALDEDDYVQTTCDNIFSDMGEDELFFVRAGVCNNYTTKPWLIFDEANDATDFQIDKFLGHNELLTGTDVARYCLNYRIEPMGAPETPLVGELAETTVWKVRVRVSWTRDGSFPENWHNCTAAEVDFRLDGSSAGAGTDFAVELVTLVTREFATQ